MVKAGRTLPSIWQNPKSQLKKFLKLKCKFRILITDLTEAVDADLECEDASSGPLAM